MSYSMLEALCNGKIIPWERTITLTPKHRKIREKIEQERLYFTQKMSPNDCERFEELYGLFMDDAYNEEAESYSHGFTLGSLIMMEIMEKKGDVIRE